MGYAERIYNAARADTPFNPGLPADLAGLVVAQSKHETGNYTSNFFRNYNNAFGYSYFAGSNYQIGAGGIADNGQPIAKYYSIEDSTREIVDWLRRRERQGVFPNLDTIKTPEQYAQLLKVAGYYGDSLQNYLNGLRAYWRPIAAIGLTLLVSAVVLGYMFRKDLFP